MLQTLSMYKGFQILGKTKGKRKKNWGIAVLTKIEQLLIIEHDSREYVLQPYKYRKNDSEKRAV